MDIPIRIRLTKNHALIDLKIENKSSNLQRFFPQKTAENTASDLAVKSTKNVLIVFPKRILAIIVNVFLARHVLSILHQSRLAIERCDVLYPRQHPKQKTIEAYALNAPF